jgi:LuxR family transcriptional regulator, maltose regulon positive regulatory protein
VTETGTTAPLLTTKLHIPPVRRARVARPRLFERLDAGRRHKLTLVSAPAGFGKTTLLSVWAQDRAPEPRVAWLTLDAGDDDPTRFLAYLVAALQTVAPDVGRGALALSRAPQPPPLESALTALVNAVAALPEPLTLVLDDYHLVSARPVHDALAFLVEHLPANLHLVIATRADPPLPLARLRGRGQLIELRQADLRFTRPEAAAFLAQTMGLALAPPEIEALAERTEGWVAGLQMAALTLVPSGAGESGIETARLVQALTGSQRYILDYLMQEVLERQPPAVQTFLLHTALLERLSAPLCDAVLGREADGQAAQATLEDLERANLFIVPLDHERRWYRYHHLFADLLRQRLGQVCPDRIPALHRRASAWYKENGFPPEAIAHALAAGDHARATDLIVADAEPAFVRGETATLLRWIAALPDELVRARPRLCALQAGAMLLNGRPPEAVAERLALAAQADPDGAVAPLTAAFQALLATLQGDVPQAAVLSETALEGLPEDRPYLRVLAANNLGLTHMMRNDLAGAARAFDEVARMSRRMGHPVAAVSALCNLAGLYMLQGRPVEAQAIYERALAAAIDAEGRRWPVAGKALLGLGELYREWNRLEQATDCLVEGIALVRQYLEVGSVVGYVSLAYVRQAQGDAAGARAALREAWQVARAFDASDFDDVLVGACEARLALAQGDRATALRWVQARGLADGAEPDMAGAAYYELREIELLTLARVYLAQGHADAASVLLASLLDKAEARGRVKRVIEALALQAQALDMGGKTEEALDALGRALALARPESYVRVWVDMGPPLAALLHAALARGIAPEYAGRLLAAFPETEMEPVPEQPDLVEPLSAREMEVLRLIAQGLSNRAIAERLVIALSTVKGHTSNIYGKLGVHNRTQAVARARALGVLEG